MKKRRNKRIENDFNPIRTTVDIGGNMVLDTTTGKVEPKSYYQKIDTLNNFPTGPSIRIVPDIDPFNNAVFDDYDDEDYDEEDDEYDNNEKILENQ